MFDSLKYYFRFRATQRVPKVCNEREKGKKLKFTLQSPDCYRAKIRISLDANVPCLFDSRVGCMRFTFLAQFQ